MKFVLFVEGYTEKCLPAFLKRWLDPKLKNSVRIAVVRFEGWSDLWRRSAKKAKMYLDNPNSDVIAVISLLDLYGPEFPSGKITVDERIQWATDELEKKVDRQMFKQFFAVHEIEAWLLSQPDHFPNIITKNFSGIVNNPENINFNNPPSKMLNNLYFKNLRKGYKKTVYGSNLFNKLDPIKAYEKCPNLKLMLDEMLKLAQRAGF